MTSFLNYLVQKSLDAIPDRPKNLLVFVNPGCGNFKGDLNQNNAGRIEAVKHVGRGSGWEGTVMLTVWGSNARKSTKNSNEAIQEHDPDC